MPICDACSCTEFICSDGKFFCVECDTQSQDSVQEEVQEVQGGGPFTTKLLKKKEKRIEKYRWKTAEGFQLIIKAHLKALIELGVHPEIDGVMQQIWFKYLQKTGQAVFDESQEVGSTAIKDMKYRDYFLENIKEEALPRMGSLKLRISKSAKKNSVGGKLNNEHDWFSVDTDDSTDEGAASSDLSDNRLGIRGYQSTDYRSWYKINTMSMLKVICFCYLSLRWRREHVTVGDLIYWANTGRIPYYGAADCFLPHMKLFQCDYTTFVAHRPLEYERVVYLSRELQKYVEMPPMPDVSVEELVARYLVQLNLPLAFAAYAKKLVLKTVKWPKFVAGLREYNIIPHRMPEMIAAGVIVVLLKLFFTLNDEFEWDMNIDKHQCPIHKNNELHCREFTWGSWVKLHSLQQARKKEKSFTLFDEGTDPNEVGDVYACMEHHKYVILKGMVSRCEVGQDAMTTQQDWIEMKSQAFRQLLDHQESTARIRDKEKERKSISNAYKLLGRGDDDCTIDFTPFCVAILAKNLLSSERKYVQYNTLEGNEKLEDFHNSYRFLLLLMQELTYANWLTIHDYASMIEKKEVEKCAK